MRWINAPSFEQRSTSYHFAMAKPDSDGQCRARFIYNHGQKPSLTFVTAATVSSALHRMYPLLLIADASLGNLMWTCEDLCLPFVHFVMIWLTASLFFDDLQWSFIHILKTWAGIMSCFFLILSFAYYVLTVYSDLQQSEPPTLDDIVIVLESVVDKLETMRGELVNQTFIVNSKVRAMKLVLLLTPVHLIMLKIISVKTYMMGFTLICLLYHSNWLQCTIKLFWRLLFTRSAYYALAGHLGNGPKLYRNPVGIERVIQSSDCIYELDVPYELGHMQGHKLQLQLQKLYPRDQLLDAASRSVSKDLHVIDFQIQENQRKWQTDGWTARMLPYERPKYCISLPDGLHACNSPWKFQEGCVTGWHWFDDCWRPADWTYSDSLWMITGTKDSLASSTRTRTWKRRIYRIAKTN